jgi:hypothetical protein
LVDLATRGKIFISYRRDDSPGDARGVRDRLSREFGKANVFMDVDNLLAGQRFDRELDNALAQCDVLVAVIGLRWMKLVSGHVRSGERDFVHDEIAAALKREIVVIPALIGRKGNMPPLPRRDDLPADIRDLVLHQKQDIAHESFGRDADDLTAAIKSVLRGERRAMPWRTIAVSGAMALILAVVLSGYWMGLGRVRASILCVLAPMVRRFWRRRTQIARLRIRAQKRRRRRRGNPSGRPPRRPNGKPMSIRLVKKQKRKPPRKKRRLLAKGSPLRWAPQQTDCFRR